MPGGYPAAMRRALTLSAVIPLAVLVACGGSGGSGGTSATAPASSAPATPTALSAWVTGGGRHWQQTLVADFGTAQKAADGQDPGALITACRTLQQDSGGAQGYSPIPDSDAESHWSRALSLVGQAAGDCVTGLENQDSAKIAATQALLGTATSELQAATARLGQVSSG